MVSLNKNDLPDKLQAVYLEGHFLCIPVGSDINIRFPIGLQENIKTQNSIDNFRMLVYTNLQLV